MRPDMTPDWTAALAAQGITTAWAVRLDFAAESIGVWTGPYSITPSASGDSLLDGVQLDPIANGIVVNMGDNSFTLGGSDQLDIVLGIPPSISTEISAANALPAEWQARPATVWRAILMQPTDPLAQPNFAFRRVRTGSMDGVEWTNDGTQISFKLTIESHASLISDATGVTYMNQRDLDPNDASQDWVVAIANGKGFTSGAVAGGGYVPSSDYTSLGSRMVSS